MDRLISWFPTPPFFIIDVNLSCRIFFLTEEEKYSDKWTERKGGIKEGRKGEKERKKKVLNEYEIHLELHILSFSSWPFSTIWRVKHIWKMKLHLFFPKYPIKLWLMEKRNKLARQMATPVSPFLTQTTDACLMSILAQLNLILFWPCLLLLLVVILVYLLLVTNV